MYCGVRRYATINRAVIRSLHLREAFIELAELPGAASVEITFAPTEPYLQFEAAGSGGSCVVDFPQGSESFISFNSTAPQAFRFHLSLLQQAVKALSVAEETFIRLNDQVMNIACACGIHLPCLAIFQACANA